MLGRRGFLAAAASVVLVPVAGLAQVVGSTNAPPTPTNYQLNKSTTTTAPSSTAAYQMMGLSGVFTPVMTGNALLTFCGKIYEPAGTAATIGIYYQISYGTGAAPANNTPVTGTQVGVIQQHENGVTIVAADLFIPFSVSTVVTGLTVGTTYWLDLAATALGTASDQGFGTVSISAIELP